MDFEARLVRIERESSRRKRRTFLTSIVVGASMFGLLLVAVRASDAGRQPATNLPQELKVSRLTLVDSHGTTRAELTMTPASNLPVLRMLDAAGRVRVVVTDEHISLLDQHGKQRVDLSCSADPRIELRNSNGTPVGVWTHDEDGVLLTLARADTSPAVALLESGLQLFDQKRRRVDLSTGKSSGLQLFDVDGRVRSQVVVEDNQPSISLFDAAGQNRATLGRVTGTTSTGVKIEMPESSLILRDPRGQVVFNALEP